MDFLISARPVDGEAVLREWLKPTGAHHAPAPRPIQLPDSWTVGSTSTGTPAVNAWTGDVPLVADGHYTCDLVVAVRLAAGTPAFAARS